MGIKMKNNSSSPYRHVGFQESQLYLVTLFMREKFLK